MHVQLYPACDAVNRIIGIFLLLVAAVLLAGHAHAQSTPALVQTWLDQTGNPSGPDPNGNGTTCTGATCTCTSQFVAQGGLTPIASGHTIWSGWHTFDYSDSVYMQPSRIYDNAGNTYNMTTPVHWLPWPEAVTVAWLTNVQGNPTTISADFTAYPGSGLTAACDVLMGDFSGVQSVINVQPSYSVLNTRPSNSVTSTVPNSLIVGIANLNWGGTTNNTLAQSIPAGASVLIDSWSWENMAMIESPPGLRPTGSYTQTWNAPTSTQNPCDSTSMNGCSSVIGIAALQPASSATPGPKSQAFNITSIAQATCGASGIQSQGSANTVTVDYSQVQTGCPIPSTVWQQAGTEYWAPGYSQDDALIKNLPLKLERTFWGPGCYAQTQGSYNFNSNCLGTGFYGDDAILNNIITQGACPVIDIGGVPGWLDNGQGIGIPNNDAEYITVLEAGLNHLATTFPCVQYLEGLNEPDQSGVSQSAVNEIYADIAAAVAAVNSSLGRKQFLVGDSPPSNGRFDTGYITGVIQYAAQQHTALDFINYHLYADGGIAQVAAAYVPTLTANGFPANTPQFVTEYGYCGSCQTEAADPYSAAENASYMETGWGQLLANNLPQVQIFDWAVNNYSQSPASIVACCGAPDGIAMPTYNAYQMMAMQRANTIAAGGFSGDQNLEPIATIDSGGAALMVSNFSSNGNTVTLTMNNLPTAYQSASFNYTEYLIDQYTSNYYTNQTGNGALQEVASGSHAAGSSFSVTVGLNPWAVYEIVLTP